MGDFNYGSAHRIYVYLGKWVEYIMTKNDIKIMGYEYFTCILLVYCFLTEIRMNKTHTHTWNPKCSADGYMTTPWLDTPQWSRPTCEAVNIIVAEHLNISLEKASRLVELGRDSSEICYVMAQMPARIGVMDTCTTKLPNTSRFMLSMETNGNNLYEKKVQTCLLFLRCCVVLRQLWDSGLGDFHGDAVIHRW